VTKRPADDRGEVVLFRTKDGRTELDVRLAGEMVWMTLNQMVELFDRDKSVISRHLRNIFETRELSRNATVAKNATLQTEGGREDAQAVEYFTRVGMNRTFDTISLENKRMVAANSVRVPYANMILIIFCAQR